MFAWDFDVSNVAMKRLASNLRPTYIMTTAQVLKASRDRTKISLNLHYQGYELTLTAVGYAAHLSADTNGRSELKSFKTPSIVLRSFGLSFSVCSNTL